MLDSITIQNFKAIQGESGLTLNNLAQVNYLVGPNGCGKSSVLEGIIGNVVDYSDQTITESDRVVVYRLLSNSEFDADKKRGLKEMKDFHSGTRTYQTAPEISIDGKKTKFGLNIKRDRDYKFFGEALYFRNNYNFSDINFYQTSYFHLYNRLSFGICKINNDSFNQYIYNYIIDQFSKDSRLKALFELLDSNMVNYGNHADGDVSVLNFFGIYQIYKDLKYETFHKYNKIVYLLLEEPEISLHPQYQKYVPIILNIVLEKIEELGLDYTPKIIISTHSPFIVSAAAKEDNQKVYLIEGGQTVDLAGRPGRIDGFEDDRCIAVASKMLGAGLSDLSNHSKLQEQVRIIYCEKTDAKLYQQIFPEYNGKRNIFIGAGGADEVVRAYYTGKEACKIAFGNKTEVYALVDASCSSPGLDTWKRKIITNKDHPCFSEHERQYFLETDPDFRMLKRKEIENYLFDPEILRLNEVSEELIKKIKDTENFISGDVKNLNNKYSSLNLNKDKLAKKISNAWESPIYIELRSCIFGNK